MIVVYIEVHEETLVFHVSLQEDVEALVERYKDNPDVDVGWQWGPSTQEVGKIITEVDERLKEYDE